MYENNMSFILFLLIVRIVLFKENIKSFPFL